MIKETNCWADAWKAAFPIFFAYFPLGMVFGLVFVEQGYAWYLAPITSAFIYGGSVQFLMLTMLDNGAAAVSIIIAVFFVALRNLFYGLSFIKRYQNLNPLLKGYLSFGLVDATYAILLARVDAPIRFCVQVTTLIYFFWVGGTLVGSLFAEILPVIKGVDFVLPSFFMVLVLDFYLVHRSLLPIILPIIFSFIAYALFPSAYLVIAICLTLIYLSLQYTFKNKEII